MLQTDLKLRQFEPVIERSKIALFGLYVSCGILIGLFIVMIVILATPVKLPHEGSMESAIKSFISLNATLSNSLNELQLLNGSVVKFGVRGGSLKQSLNEFSDELFSIYIKDVAIIEPLCETINGIVKLLFVLKKTKLGVFIKKEFINNLKELSVCLSEIRLYLNQILNKSDGVITDFSAFLSQFDLIANHLSNSLSNVTQLKSVIHQSIGSVNSLLNITQQTQTYYYVFIIMAEGLCSLLALITIIIIVVLYRHSYRYLNQNEKQPLLHYPLH